MRYLKESPPIFTSLWKWVNGDEEGVFMFGEKVTRAQVEKRFRAKFCLRRINRKTMRIRPLCLECNLEIVSGCDEDGWYLSCGCGDYDAFKQRRRKPNSHQTTIIPLS